MLSDYDELPPDEEMHPELRWYDDYEPNVSDEPAPVEALIHERTGTKVDIFKTPDHTYSVQPHMGGADQRAVVQDDQSVIKSPIRAVVTTVDHGDRAAARAIAMAWMLGWMHRTHHADTIRDLEA